MNLRIEKGRKWLILACVTAFLLVAVVAGIGAGAYWMFVEFPAMDECALVVHRTVSSPDGRLSAVVFETECGATVDYNTHVSVAPADAPFSRKTHPSFLALSGQHDLAIKWTGERALEIVLPKGETIYRNDPTIGNVTVVYR